MEHYVKSNNDNFGWRLLNHSLSMALFKKNSKLHQNDRQEDSLSYYILCRR